MPITYLPSNELDKMLPEKLLDRLMTGTFRLNKTVINMLSRSDLISKENIQEAALKVIKQYKVRYKGEVKDGSSKAEAFETATNDNVLLIQRVKNQVVFDIKEKIKDEYDGEKYIWLPSSAITPDPLHQLKYGKKFRIGVGEMPGDREGCLCGLRILVKGDALEL